MPLSEESRKIYNAFCRYVEDGDVSLVEDFTEDKLKFTLLQVSNDQGWPGYLAIEKRITELKENRISKRNSKEKWKDRFIGAGVTIVVGFIGALLKVWFNL